MIKNIVTISPSKTSPDILEECTVNDLYKIITESSEDIKAKTQKIKDTTDPNVKDNIKNSLPMVGVNGRFKYRSLEGMTEYGRLIMIDIDRYDTSTPDGIRLRDSEWDRFKRNDHVKMMFHTPRGNIKILVEHNNSDQSHHEELYFAIAKMFPSYYGEIDEKCHDLARFHYITHDPVAYYNPSSRVYRFNHDNSYLEVSRRVPVSIPFEVPNLPGFSDTTPIVNIPSPVVTSVPTASIPKDVLKILPLITDPVKEEEVLVKVYTEVKDKLKMIVGKRNTRIYQIAIELRKNGISQDSAIEHLGLMYMEDGFTWSEIERQTRKAYSVDAVTTTTLP